MSSCCWPASPWSPAPGPVCSRPGCCSTRCRWRRCRRSRCRWRPASPILPAARDRAAARPHRRRRRGPRPTPRPRRHAALDPARRAGRRPGTSGGGAMTGTMVGAVLRGIRSRSLLSVGSVLLILLAIGSAMLGPVFQVAVTKSYVVTRLNEAPPRATGVSRLLVPDAGLPRRPAGRGRPGRRGGPGARPGPVRGAHDAARDQRASRAASTTPTGRRAWCGCSRRTARATTSRSPAVVPTSPGQALVLAGDAEYAGLEIGDQIPLTGGLPNVTMVGTYRVPAAAEEFWYDITRFDSVPRRIDDISGDVDPFQPGPLVVDTRGLRRGAGRPVAGPRRPPPRRTSRLDRCRPVGRGALRSGGRRRPGADRERIAGRRRRSVTCRRCWPRCGPRRTPPATPSRRPCCRWCWSPSRCSCGC